MKVTAKHKYASIGFIYLFGLICASFLDSRACFIFLGLLAVLFAASAGRSDFYLRLCIAAFGMAFLVFGLYHLLVTEPCESFIGSSKNVIARVEEVRAPDNDTVLLTVSGTADGKAVKLTLFTTDTGISVGDTVEFEAVFSKFSDSAEFSESGYYFSKGVFLKAYATGEIVVTGSNPGPDMVISGISDYFKGVVDTSFSEGSGGIVKAMFFGDKSGLSHITRTDMMRSGISHLTAVSGMHLSLMVHLFAVALSFLIRRGGRIYYAVISVYVVFLMLFFGMTASVMRSGFMMLVFYGSEFLYRKSDTISSVGMALVIILLMNPCACRDAGLWLSVAGTVGVGVVAPAVSEVLKHGRKNVIADMMLSSVCASVCTMPVGAVCFGGISFAAPVTTILVQPFFTVLLAVVPVSLLIPFLSWPLLFVAGYAARIMEIISGFISGIDFSYIPTDGETVVLFLVGLISGTVITAFIARRMKPVVVFASVMTAAFAASQVLYGIISYDDIRINIYADSGDTIVQVSDKTGTAFYMLSTGGDAASVIYENLSGSQANFICIAEEAGNCQELSSLSRNIHLPQDGNMNYDVSGEYSAAVADAEIILDIRGISIGILPAGSLTEADIRICCGYKENYGPEGKSATILCDKKYYNCGEAVNAFLNKTEFVINNGGMYALATG